MCKLLQSIQSETTGTIVLTESTNVSFTSKPVRNAKRRYKRGNPCTVLSDFRVFHRHGRAQNVCKRAKMSLWIYHPSCHFHVKAVWRDCLWSQWSIHMPHKSAILKARVMWTVKRSSMSLVIVFCPRKIMYRINQDRRSRVAVDQSENHSGSNCD